MVILTALTFIVAVVTLFVFYRQFGEMRTQTGILSTQSQQAAADSIDAAKRVERQLVIAQQQADATKKSVGAIRRQVRQDQRAWIRVSINPLPVFVGKEVVASGEYTNTGKTAAHNVIVNLVVERVKNGKDPIFTWRILHYTGWTGMMYPNAPEKFSSYWFDVPIGTKGRPSPTIISMSDVSDLMNGKTYFVVFGEVRYEDIFQVRHRTEFCKWIPIGNADVTARKCIDHNTEDNN